MRHLFKYKTTLVSVALTFTAIGCGAKPQSSSSLQSDEDRTAVLFSTDTEGNWSFGRPEHARTIADINGYRSAGAEKTEHSDTVKVKSEKVVVKADPEDMYSDPGDCFAHEAAASRYDTNRNLPTIRATTAIEIAEERFQNMAEADSKIEERLQKIAATMYAAHDSSKTSIDALKMTIKTTALAHNEDTYKALAMAGVAVDASLQVASDFKTSPLTAHGAKLHRAWNSLQSAVKALPTKFSGEEFTRRSQWLKTAGITLKLADTLLSRGDVETGEYLIKVARTLIDVSLSLIPVVGWVKDMQEAATGYSIIYGRNLTPVEHGFAVFGAVTGGLGSKAALAGKHLHAIETLFIETRAGQQAIDAVVAASKMLGN